MSAHPLARNLRPTPPLTFPVHPNRPARARIVIVFMRVQWPDLERQHHTLREVFHLANEDAIAEALKAREQVVVASTHHAVLASEIAGGVAVRRIATFWSPRLELLPPAAAAAKLRSSAAAPAASVARKAPLAPAIPEVAEAVEAFDDESADAPAPPPPPAPAVPPPPAAGR